MKRIVAAAALSGLQLVSTWLAENNLQAAALARGAIANAVFFWIVLLLFAPAVFGRARWLGYIVIAIGSGMLNTHVLVNASLPLLGHAGLATDSTFLIALLQQPEFYITSLAALAIMAAIDWLPLRFPRPTKFAAIAVAALVAAFLTLTALSLQPPFNRWYAQSLPEFNLRMTADSSHAAHVNDGRTLVDSRTAEQMSASRVNHVFVLIVEGLSEAHVDAGWLPNLRELERRGMRAGRFVNHQRHTNRGLYSLLCGAYPNLHSSVAKSDLMSLAGLKQACLPALLESHGITSAFIQSAKLSYMSKDLFSTAAGFSVIRGLHEIDNPDMVGPWGVDDRSLFRAGLQFAAEQERSFVVMLTTGTHPPYKVPGGQGKQAAFEFADQALAYVVAELERTGKLQESIVVVTSDESSVGNLATNSDIPNDNLGYLLAIGGGLPAGVADGVRGQVDLPAMTTDFFGLGDYDSGVALLDQPQAQRRLYAANTYKQELYEITAETVVTCDSNFVCSSPDAQPRMRSLVARNDIATVGASAVLGHMSNRAFDTARDTMVLGRFVTERPQGTTLVASLTIDTRNPQAPNAGKIISLLGWDCGDRVSGNIRMQAAAPAGRESIRVVFPFPQRYAQQCHKLWVQEEDATTSSTWHLHELSFETVAGESKAIEHLTARSLTSAPVPRIAHAGGALQGRTYTNSLVALDRNYAAGFRYFEIDFIWTADDRLVCGHDWSETLEENVGLSYSSPPTFAKLREDLADRVDAPCTLESLQDWTDANAGVRIVSDIKQQNVKGLALIRSLYPALAERLIPQIYSPQEHALARELHYDEIILTLYRYRGSTEQLLAALTEIDLFAVTMPRQTALNGMGVLLNSLGLATYTHTINDAEDWTSLRDQWAITEIYTDFLVPENAVVDAQSFATTH